jgi:hypothetical protein
MAGSSCLNPDGLLPVATGTITMPLNSGSTAIHPYDGLSLTCGARSVTGPLERSRQRLGKDRMEASVARCLRHAPPSTVSRGKPRHAETASSPMSLLCSARDTSTSGGVSMRRYGPVVRNGNGGFTLINKSPDTSLKTRRTLSTCGAG